MKKNVKKVHKAKAHPKKKKPSKGKEKVEKVMHEFKAGKLHSGSKSGPEVENPKQAIAIALSEARKSGAKIPKKKKQSLQICDVFDIGISYVPKKGLYMSHEKIMKKCSSDLMKDAKHYEKDAKHTKSKVKKKHDMVEKKEAVSAAKDLKKRAKMSHEY